MLSSGRHNRLLHLSIGNPTIFFTKSSSSLSPWILDSGASNHMSGNHSLLSHVQTSQSLPPVTLADGSQTSIMDIGTALPLPTLPLSYILHLPQCTFNLFSVSQLTRNLNCFITFLSDSILVQDRRTKRTIGTGLESHGLYYLSSPASLVACTTTTSPLQVHCRLGTHLFPFSKRWFPVSLVFLP